MEELISRFPHIALQIFEQLDNKILVYCREVVNAWQNFIDDKNLIWIRIVNIPTILNDGNTYLHVAARTKQTMMFRMIFYDEEFKNPRNSKGETPFHIVCDLGYFEIAEIIIEKSIDFHLNLNKQDNCDRTPFQNACSKGYKKIVDMLLKKSSEFNFKLGCKNALGLTAFHFACLMDHYEIAEMLMQKSSEIDLDLNSTNIFDGMTAFSYACFCGHSKIVEMIMQKSTQLNIDLNIKINSIKEENRTAFHYACKYGRLEVVKLFMQKSDELNTGKSIFSSKFYH